MTTQRSNWYALASELADILKAVEGVGIVHTEIDWPELEDDISFMLGEDVESAINAWTVNRQAIGQDRGDTPPQQWNRVHGFVIRGYISITAGSGIGFQYLVEDVLDAFSPPRRLTASPNAVMESLPQAVAMIERPLAEGLPRVHYVEIAVPVMQLHSQYRPD